MKNPYEYDHLIDCIVADAHESTWDEIERLMLQVHGRSCLNCLGGMRDPKECIERNLIFQHQNGGEQEVLSLSEGSA